MSLLPLLTAFLLGLCLPQLALAAPLSGPGLALLLFLGFLGCHWRAFRPGWLELRLLGLWLVLALAAGLLWHGWPHPLTQGALLLLLAPTATAAPAIIGWLGGRRESVTGLLLGSHLLFVLLVPWLLPLAKPLPLLDLARQLGLTLVLPLLLALVLSQGPDRLLQGLKRAQPLGPWLWAALVAISVSRARPLLLEHSSQGLVLLAWAMLALCCCLLNFQLGRWLAGRANRCEGQIVMGQKNTLLLLWLCVQLFDPILALAPLFYMLWHNLYSGCLLARQRRQQARLTQLTPQSI